MLLRKRLLPASLFLLLMLTLSQVGYPQTSDDITIGILDVYTVDYSQELVDRVRYALRDELIAAEWPGLKVAIGTDIPPAGVIATSREYFHKCARVNEYDYYLVSSVLQKPTGLYADIQLFLTHQHRLIWNRSSWYVGTDHLIKDFPSMVEQMLLAVDRNRAQQSVHKAALPGSELASRHREPIDWDYGLGVLLCYPARRDPLGAEWASGFGVGVFQELTSYDGLERVFPNWISSQIGCAAYAGYNRMGFVEEEVFHQARVQAQVLLPFFLDFFAVGAAYHAEWGQAGFTNIAGATTTLIYLSSNDVWWPFVYEIGTIRYLYDFSRDHWYVEIDFLRIGVRVIP